VYEYQFGSGVTFKGFTKNNITHVPLDPIGLLTRIPAQLYPEHSALHWESDCTVQVDSIAPSTIPSVPALKVRPALGIFVAPGIVGL